MMPAEPVTPLGTAWAALMTLVPARKRGRALELMLFVQAEYSRRELLAKGEGVQDGIDAAVKTCESGYKDGWEEGFNIAVNDVLGRTGSPAQERYDGDLLTRPPEPPAS